MIILYLYLHNNICTGTSYTFYSDDNFSFKIENIMKLNYFICLIIYNITIVSENISIYIYIEMFSPFNI